MSQRARLILVAVLGFLLCVAVYFLLVRSRQGELNDLNQQISDEQNRTLQLRAELTRLEALREEAPQLQAELEKFRDLVPEDHETGDLIFQIEQAADEAGVDFVEITPELPKSPPEGAPLAEVRMIIGGRGGYFALQDFTRRLYSLDRAMRIDNLTLAVEEDPTGGFAVRLTATARVFFDLPVAPGTATTGTTTGAAPATPAPEPAATP